MRRPMLGPLILTLAAASSLGAGETQLGKIDFPTSGSPEAREAFLRGVLYLHSFEYGDARDAFVEARELDADFAMAYWGEAMTYNHPIWLEENVDAAREALARLAPTPDERAAKAATEREKGYLRTVEILYGDGGKRHRDRAYSEALGPSPRSTPTISRPRASTRSRSSAPATTAATRPPTCARRRSWKRSSTRTPSTRAPPTT